MTDDLLDAEKDLAEQKFTYLTFYGEAETRTRIEQAAKQALAILSPYDNEAARELKETITAMVHRTA